MEQKAWQHNAATNNATRENSIRTGSKPDKAAGGATGQKWNYNNP
jgi:hypothetical protein